MKCIWETCRFLIHRVSTSLCRAEIPCEIRQVILSKRHSLKLFMTQYLEDYEEPHLDPAKLEALEDYVARRKASMPDQNY